MFEPTMPWSATIAVADVEEPPPTPPVWRQGESVEAYERALVRWLRDMLAWVRHHDHPHHHHRAVRLRLTVGGNVGAVSISVDAQGEKATVQWIDDKGDVTDPAVGPDGAPASVQFQSSDPTVLDVAADGSLTLNKSGVATITATAVDSTGAVLPNFGEGSVDVTVNPGTATAFEVTVTP